MRATIGGPVLRVKHTEGLVRETARVKEVYFEVLWKGSARDEGGNYIRTWGLTPRANCAYCYPGSEEVGRST